LNIWDLLIQQPLVNILIVMSHYLGGSYGLAIIFLTLVINLALYPLTKNQIKSSLAMQNLQPKLAELQKKYGKDRQKLAQEQMKLYKESGVKPAGCAITMIIQMPVWIALYQSIMLALAVAPEGLLHLSRYLYPWHVVYASLPLSHSFLGMDLAHANPILAILVGVGMWVQQKMSTPPSTDPRSQQQSTMMLWMMPMLFTFMALTFPAGLSIYWIASSVFRILMQYRVTGLGGLRKQPPPAVDAGKKYVKFDAAQGDKADDKEESEIIVKDSGPSKDNQNPYKPSKFKYSSDKNKDKDKGNPKK
jgi:YidC/Oxa1 family membrane protein insertase